MAGSSCNTALAKQSAKEIYTNISFNSINCNVNMEGVSTKQFSVRQTNVLDISTVQSK